MAAARKSSRYGHRDATMILICYRHGLRASELCDLQWSQVELTAGRLHVRRAKNGSPSVHPMQGDEIRALRRSHHIFGPVRIVLQERNGTDEIDASREHNQHRMAVGITDEARAHLIPAAHGTARRNAGIVGMPEPHLAARTTGDALGNGRAVSLNADGSSTP
jgi:integrase